MDFDKQHGIRSSEWRIYYDDGSVFASDDGSWSEAPADGVIFITQKIGDKLNVLSGSDFYYTTDEEIVHTNDLGPLLRQLGFIKFGRWTSWKKYEQAAEQVRRDSGN